MRRREFFIVLGGALAIWPFAARAQRAAMPVIGFLGSETPALWASRLQGFHQGLSEAGYVEGQNVTIEYRWAEGHTDRLPALVADLVRRQVAVIAATGGTAVALAAKAANSKIPIVFNVATDPVALGLVSSLSRPGGNLTGAASLSVQVGAKRLQLLHELLPTATVVALLVNPTNPTVADTQTRDLQAAARTLGLQLHVLHASTEADFDKAFVKLVQLRASGLVIGTDLFFNTRSEQLAALTVRHAVPTVFQYREFVAAGGLMSYGGSIADPYRLVGGYTGRILKGEKPADLPIQQATKVELFINLKTAKALGLTVPQSLLQRAER